MKDKVAANLHLWEGWTGIHVASEYYDIDGFVANPDSRPFDWVTRGVIGDVSGKRVLHLQCHVGIDTARLVFAGASEATGVDFSPSALDVARSIAERLDLPMTFVQGDVMNLSDEVPEAAFDVAFTSYGTIMWLPDLDGWARTIASRLAPGGVFHIIDVHPFLTVFDDFAEQPPLRVHYPYFAGEALHFEEHGSYADRDADFHADSYAWQHPVSEILRALVRQGLQIQDFGEYPVVAWKALEFMEQDADGFWRLPPGTGDIPLMFSVTALKPAE